IGDNTRIDLIQNTTLVEQVREETFTLSYENFVTAESGLNMKLTTHQVIAIGGAGINHILGNKLANTLNGGGGNDQLFGDAGNDWLNGGA
ncbi:hypothetical protein, partial [Bacillus altitudinis]|uniref:hypothetical protein n=1 Tax=Bacillus altitudinis TaxID=293387 RepID=UPI002F929409